MTGWQDLQISWISLKEVKNERVTEDSKYRDNAPDHDN